jgi:hypothetical protein
MEIRLFVVARCENSRCAEQTVGGPDEGKRRFDVAVAVFAGGGRRLPLEPA